jgi:hypothetical protein
VKNAVFWDVTQCTSCKNRHFGGMYRHHQQVDKNRRARNNISSVLPLLVTANVVLSSKILVTLMMDAIRSSETSVLIRATRRNIHEVGILGFC